MLKLSRVINTLVRGGHKEEDVLWRYSIEKTKRYYDDLIELEIEDLRSNTISIYRAVSAAVLTESNQVNRDRAKAFKEYIDDLDVDKQKKKHEEKKKDPFAPLRGLIPFS